MRHNNRNIYSKVLLIIIVLFICNTGSNAQMYSYISPTTTGNAFPLASTTSNLCQFLYLPSYFPGAPAGNLTKIYIRGNTATPITTFTNLTVKMGTTNVTAFTTGTFISGLTTVYTAATTTTPAAIPAGGWFELTLQTPFAWNMTDNLIVEISQMGYTSGLTIAYNSAIPLARHYGSASGTTGTAGSGLLNFGFDLVTTPCAGVPVPGAAVSNPVQPCLGTSASLSLNPASLNTGINYQWEQFDGTNWINVIGGTGATSSSYQTPPVTGTIRYRAKLSCTNGAPLPPSAISSEVAVAPFLTTLPYLEDFESITAADQMPRCMTADLVGSAFRTYTANQTSYNRNNHTTTPTVGSKFGSFYYSPAGTHGLYTPIFNLTAGSTYLFTFWYVVGNSANAAPTNFTGLNVYYGTAPNVTAMTNLIGSVPASPISNTTYQQFTQTFTPSVSGAYHIGILATHTTTTVAYLSVDDIGLNLLSPCTGRPTAGTITAPAPCPNEVFTLTRNGGTSATSVGNINYQWQDSTANGWQNSIGASATTTNYTTSITAPTRFRVILTCSLTGQGDTSASYTVAMAPFINCYCTPTYTGTTTSTITNVKLRNLNNTSGGAAPYYTNYAPQQPAPIPLPTITMGTTDTVIVTNGSYTINYTGVWIDFDHSGVFEPAEFFSLGTTVGANAISRVPITIPNTALPGITRMRIRGGDRSPVTAAMPCGNTASNYGEAEDYNVNVEYAPCNGPLDAGIVRASDSFICKGYTINLANTTHEARRSHINWSWQQSQDFGLTWNTIAGSLGKDTLNNVLINGPVSYRMKVVCELTGDSTFSGRANIRIKNPYECYCYSQSNGGDTDSSDIGAVVIGTVVNATGGPHILNPTALRKRTDYTDIPNIVLSANRKYRLSIYHIQRNGFHANARVSVFIDYNNDLRYDVNAQPNSELVFTGISLDVNYYIDTVINVPDGVVPNAPTGLRVIINNDLDANAPANQGCGPYVSGETEDYVIKFDRLPQGVGQVMNLEEVTLYPNPTSGKFTVSARGSKSMDQVAVTVTTITGQQIMKKGYSKVGNKFVQELDLSDVAKGIYFVEIKTENGDKMVQKLVIR